MLSTAANLVYVALLVVVVPVVSAQNARILRRHPIPRRQLYLSALLSQWTLGLAGIGVAALRYENFSSLGFRNLSPGLFFGVTGGLAMASLGALTVFVTFHVSGIWKQESEVVRQLLPESGKEKLAAILLLAPTAALCEEFIYRGYLLRFLLEGTDSDSAAWLLSSVIFGLAHSYQGVSGVLRASLLGALLAFPVLHYGSLYPSMIVHFAIDAVALAWVGPRFWKSRSATESSLAADSAKDAKLSTSDNPDPS